ncbi:MAG: hypothetical protein AAFU77_16630 [Myxococcota bacterium]
MSLGYRDAVSIHRFRDPQGSIELWTVSGLVCTRAVGYLTAATMEAYFARQHDVIEQLESPVTAFRNYSEVHGFEPQAKIRTSAWVLRNRQRFRAIHFFAHSSHVALAAQSMSFTSGSTMHIYDTPDELESAFADALREARGGARLYQV